MGIRAHINGIFSDEVIGLGVLRVEFHHGQFLADVTVIITPSSMRILTYEGKKGAKPPRCRM